MAYRSGSPSVLAAEVRNLLNELDPDADRPGLDETPERVAKWLIYATAGYETDPKDVIKLFEDGAEGVDEMIVQGGIPFFSLCEHHMVPFFGVVHVGYLPDKKIVGLSKFARLVEVFARRLQVQERLSTQIADALTEHLAPKGVGVVIRARHLCMEARGVQKTGTITYTSALRGCFKEGAIRAEFMKFVEMADGRTGLI